ncbi:hypothetical protein L1787_12890 [Acuticoccus sp. M5D2P5]|uniref:hypothetical protein n=1 Tax=Acuticoccus kalidii TaxID=2910977 RepID=UPI001F16E777|nr:hypothetical protein [Acuticoccus kalidii]MCF3934305.1 hypothetical protein [Acuticoccus kalidii]
MMRRPTEELPKAGEYCLIGWSDDPNDWRIVLVGNPDSIDVLRYGGAGTIFARPRELSDEFRVIRVGPMDELEAFRVDLAAKMATPLTDRRCAEARYRRAHETVWVRLSELLAEADQR